MSSLTPSNNALIAGQACGIRIRATPQSKPVFDKLAAQAKTNYWAYNIVHGIQALCSGRMHLNNVFIKQQDIANNNGEFYVVLPGCTATLEKTSNGECRLLYMRADENYFRLQSAGKEPGLHAVTKDGDAWKTQFNANGKITNTPDRFVAITDRHAKTIPETLEAAWPTFSDNPLRSSRDLARPTGFDVHYTPGSHRIGGLTNVRQAIRAATDPELHESAILLAQTMKDARDIEGVLWVSESGGSGVLTQALQILVDQGVKLHETHSIFLCNPTTRQSTIQELSLKLGLGQPRRIARNNAVNLHELVGGLGFGGGYATAYQRLKHDKKYTALKFAGDIVKESTSLDNAAGVATTMVTAGSLTAAAVGLTAAGAALPAVFAFAAAAIPIGKASKALTEAYLPRLYKKITGKF